MKPDWDSLGSEFKDSPKVLIGDVDCTAAGKSLCDKYGVRGYPTIKYFNPPDEEGEDYKGGRDLASLKKFASTELGPGCSVDTMENCDAAQKTELEKYIAMPAAERDAKLAELKKAMADAEEEHNSLLKQLQATFKESQEKLEKLKEDAAPQIKLLKAATPGPKKDGAKDEV
mmetsp:Transcript_23333/g.47490  ORF Transcript_23333/g.47490 Transcript_23333/m.47490 type:complete len:172 (+) Transcript_23333:196-711(+)